MADALLFEDRERFRQWLMENVDHGGVWLLFGKKGGPRTLSAAHALEEALCFGWIDGQMESLDEGQYRKYFAPRRAGSNWSQKNRALAERLEAEGRMTPHGRGKIEEARQDGRWDAQPRGAVAPQAVDALAERLRPYALAYEHFMRMPPSARRTYTGWCLDVRSEAAGEKRFAQLVQRLEANLKPMEKART